MHAPNPMGSGSDEFAADDSADPPASGDPPESFDLLDALDAYAAVLRPDGTVLHANRAALAVAGLTLADVRGRPFWHCAWWQPDAAIAERCRRACERAAAGESVRCEIEVPPGGRRVAIECRFAPVRDANGRVRRVLASAVDITRRSRADAALLEREAFLRSVLDASSDCIKTLDLEGRLEYVNASGLCQLEVDDFETFRGVEWASLWPEEARDRVRRAVANARAGSIDRFEGYCPTTRGQARWWDVVVAPVPDADGRVTRILAVSRDVTSRSASEATLRSFYEVSPLMMGTVELLPDGDILHLYDNPATSRFFGRRPGRTSQVTARALGVPEETIARWRARYELATRRGAPVSFEHTQPAADGGSPLTLAITVAPLASSDAVAAHTYCYVAQDVTGTRAAAAALQDADRRKDEFLATLSHELRNPLAPIRNAATLLDSPKLGTEGLAFARQVIQRQVAHMARLLDDLLDVARITQGKLELRREPTTLCHVVEDALEAARPLLERKAHVLAVNLPPEPVVLDVDPVRIAQVLTNLLTNAAKYTDDGGRIELAVATAADGVTLTVRDNGIGLTPQALATVFTMFNQIPCARDRSEGGLGIGLALVRAVVELHGGTLTAHSDGPGRGSEFRVHLPGPGPRRNGGGPVGRANATVSIEAAHVGATRVEADVV